MHMVSLPRLRDGELLSLTQQAAFWQENMQADQHSHCLWWQKLAHHQAHEIRLLLVVIARSDMSERVQAIHKAGLRLRRLTLSCFDYCDWSELAAGFCLLVLDDEDPVCLAVTERGIELRHAEQLRESLSLAAADQQRLSQASWSQCSRLVRQLMGESSLRHVRVVGMPQQKQQAALDGWQTLFPQSTIELHSPLTLCRGWGDNFVEARAAMRAMRRRRWFFSSAAVNLQRTPQARLGARLQCHAVWWLLAAVGVVTVLVYWHASSEVDPAQLQETKSFYQSSLNAEQEIAEQLHARAKELRRHHAYLNQFDNIKQMRRRLPVLLSAFEASVPHGLWLSQVHKLESGQVKIHGTAINDRLAHQFIGNLSARMLPLQVDIENARFSNSEDHTLRQFVLTVRIAGRVDDAASVSHATPQLKP